MTRQAPVASAASAASIVSVALVALLAGPGCRRDRHDEAGTTHTTSATTDAAGRGGSGEANAKPKLSDPDIAREADRMLREDRLLGRISIAVTVRDGIAALSGAVPTLLAKDRAVALAGTIKGVRAVVDDIHVIPPPRTDAQIMSDLTAELRGDPAERAHPITVDVKKGVVTLTGSTDSPQARVMIENAAKSIAGVTSVDDRIAVHYAMIRADNEIAADVKTRLSNDVWLDGQNITADVHDGVVTLHGLLASAAQRERAARDGWVAGVNKVDTSGLTVDWWASSNQRHVIDYPVRSDAEIAEAVRDAFRYDPRLRDMQPAVAVNLGTVTLTGHVESARARAAAEEDARNTIGAWQVRNEVTAPPAAKANGAAPDLAAQWAADNAVGEWPTGLDRSPDGLTARIHDFFFWDPMVDSDRIEVSVSPDGVATLKGTVDTWTQIRAATNEARAAGARRVVNLLALRNHPEVASPDR